MRPMHFNQAALVSNMSPHLVHLKKMTGVLNLVVKDVINERDQVSQNTKGLAAFSAFSLILRQRLIHPEITFLFIIYSLIPNPYDFLLFPLTYSKIISPHCCYHISGAWAPTWRSYWEWEGLVLDRWWALLRNVNRIPLASSCIMYSSQWTSDSIAWKELNRKLLLSKGAVVRQPCYVTTEASIL